MVELNKITYKDTGTFDMRKVIDNFDRLSDAVDDVERLRVALNDDVTRMFPPALSYAIDTMEDHTILDKAVRAEMRVKQVYVMAGAEGEETQITILKNGVDALCEPIVLKSTEGRGKVVIGEVLGYMTISRFDEVIARSDSNRRVVVSMSFEAVE